MSRIERDVVLPETPCSLLGLGSAGSAASPARRRPLLDRLLDRASPFSGVDQSPSRVRLQDVGRRRGEGNKRAGLRPTGNNGSEEWAEKWAYFRGPFNGPQQTHLPHIVMKSLFFRALQFASRCATVHNAALGLASREDCRRRIRTPPPLVPPSPSGVSPEAGELNKL